MKLNLFAGLAAAALIATPVLAKDKKASHKAPKTEAACTEGGGTWTAGKKKGKGTCAMAAAHDAMMAPAAGDAAPAAAPAAGEPAPAADGAK